MTNTTWLRNKDSIICELSEKENLQKPCQTEQEQRHVPEADPKTAKASFLKEFILLFRPEDSSRLSVGNGLSVKISPSVKALVWTVLAIALGLGIGQLH